MKYPFILFFRYDKYNYIDTILKDNAKNLDCSIIIINKKEKLNKIYKQIYSLLVTFGPEQSEYESDLSEFTTNSNIIYRLIHINDIKNIIDFNININNLFVNTCALDRTYTRPIFSIFTTSFNSFEKIIRAFNSLKLQTLHDWEWIIIDDSPNDKNFNYLKTHLSSDCRVRLYKRFENNGYIGNVKNEAISLCRGKYVLELDHDDEILPFVLKESAELFNKHTEIGFIYMDFINIYENGDNFFYGNHICKGYGSYYCQKYNDKWVYVYNTPNINNITLSHLVCCPNHPRIWRRDILLKIGNYSEFLPICDDYEIILRTALNTKIAKIHKMGYIQYMNKENNNFSLIRNAEINRIGPYFISPIYYQLFNITEEMKKNDAFDDEKYLNDHTIIWKRDPNDYSYKYCNLLVNSDYERQFCIIGLDGLLKNIEKIKDLYKNLKNDFIILENKCTLEYLWKKIDQLGFFNMKCYSLIDETEETLVNYFFTCYKFTNNYEIISSNIKKLNYNSHLKQRHEVINSVTKSDNKYLEIGVEFGYTFLNTHFSLKIGVDPDPKCDTETNKLIIKCNSDDFFLTLDTNKKFDVIFIDGMHHCENVLRDFNNSIKVLNLKGIILIDDILPLNYNEQLKIPIKHYYENGILKYGEEWTGDVWKFIYHLLKNYNDNIKFSYFYNINYRGIILIQVLEQFNIIVSEDELNKYDYHENFNEYLQLLENK
jgi:glycosyltransferase involved in cell wall biosynthesis